MPAVMPAVSWSPASDGPTASTLKSEKVTGRAPYLRLVARLLAELSVKLPSIWGLPSRISAFIVGAEMTWPSRTAANWRHGGDWARPPTGGRGVVVEGLGP